MSKATELHCALKSEQKKSLSYYREGESVVASPEGQIARRGEEKGVRGNPHDQKCYDVKSQSEKVGRLVWTSRRTRSRREGT